MRVCILVAHAVFLRRNFVCSANLGMRFDLASLLTKSHKRAELVPKKNCLVMKLAAPRATAMLFANGKLVCTGADSEDAIKAAARKFTQVIQKMDHPGVNLIDFKIQNVVGECELGFRVLVEALSFAHNDHCTVRTNAHFYWQASSTCHYSLSYVTVLCVFSTSRSSTRR